MVLLWRVYNALYQGISDFNLVFPYFMLTLEDAISSPALTLLYYVEILLPASGLIVAC
jgi:hypothetical protein